MPRKKSALVTAPAANAQDILAQYENLFKILSPTVDRFLDLWEDKIALERERLAYQIERDNKMVVENQKVINFMKENGKAPGEEWKNGASSDDDHDDMLESPT